MKLHVVLATVPMMGHLSPLLPYAEELLRRGHEVVFVHHEDAKYRRKLEQSGLSSCLSLTYKDKAEIYDCIKNYYESFDSKPSIIVHDFFAVDAADAADFLKVPAISIFPNLAVTVNPWANSNTENLNWKVWCNTFIPLMEGILARVLWINRARTRKSRNLPILPEQDIFPCKYQSRRPIIGSTLPILEYNSASQLPNELFTMVGPSLPSKFDPVGKSLMAWLEEQTQKYRKIIYVAFGSMYSHTPESVQKFQSELLELGDDIAIAWSLPEKDQAHLDGPIPLHWRIEKFFSQIALFQTGMIDVFVTHCGSNSVFEALLSGIPMVCYPGFGDQPGNAVRLHKSGVAVIANKKEGILEPLKDVLKNMEIMKSKSIDLAYELKKSGGAIKAVDVIEEVADKYKREGSNVGKVLHRRIPWWPFSIAIFVCFFFSAIF